MDGDGGVDDEAAVLSVLEEDAIEARGVAIGPGDGGREIVEDEAADDAAKEGPGRLQAVEHGGEILAQADGQEGVAAAAQRDEQAVHAPAPLGAGVEPVPEHAEVGLGDLTGRWLGHPHRECGGAEGARRAREPVQRAVGDGEARATEPAVDLRQAQPLGQPLLDRRGMRPEPLQLRARGAGVGRPPRAARGGDRAELLIGGRWTPALEADRARRLDIGGDRLAVHARAPGNRPDALAAQPPSENLAHFHHPELPVGHGPSFRRAAWPGQPGWRNVSEQVADSF